MSRLRTHLADLSGLTVASIAATGVDLVVFLTLIRYAQTALWIAVGAGAIAGAIVHFSLCKFWVFGRFDQTFSTAAWRYVFASGMALLGHELATAMYAGTFPVEMAWVLSKTTVFLFWIYPMSRYYVFGTIEGSVRAPNTPITTLANVPKEQPYTPVAHSAPDSSC